MNIPSRTQEFMDVYIEEMKTINCSNPTYEQIKEVCTKIDTDIAWKKAGSPEGMKDFFLKEAEKQNNDGSLLF